MTVLKQLRDCQYVVSRKTGWAEDCTWGPNDHIHELTGTCVNGQYERHHAYQPAHEHHLAEICLDCGQLRELVTP